MNSLYLTSLQQPWSRNRGDLHDGAAPCTGVQDGVEGPGVATDRSLGPPGLGTWWRVSSTKLGIPWHPAVSERVGNYGHAKTVENHFSDPSVVKSAQWIWCKLAAKRRDLSGWHSISPSYTSPCFEHNMCVCVISNKDLKCTTMYMMYTNVPMQCENLECIQ